MRPAPIIPLATLLLVPAPAIAQAEAARGAALPDPVAREVEALVRRYAEARDVPGLSIGVVDDGRLAWSAGFGLADVENDVPATARTVYRTASIGKPMTAVAVLQLAERGLLDLDAPVRRHCPAFPREDTRITPRRLLAHTAGIRHYVPRSREREIYNTRRYRSVGESLEAFSDDPLAYEPGTRHEYSTFGYNLLGCAVEGAAGTSYLRYMEERVFGPAGMADTRDDDPRAVIPRRAAGYVRDSAGGLGNARFADMSNRLPAGGFVTSVEDLARFAIAFMDGTLVSDSTRRAMLEPQRTANGEVVPYGLGWGLFPGEDWYGLAEAFHGGGTPGVSGMLYLIPERRFAVALLANLEGLDERVDLCARIARVVLGLSTGSSSS